MVVEQNDLLARNAELQKLVRELQEKNQQQFDFLANLAHEVRTPLAAIQYVAQLMEMESPDTAEPASMIGRQVGTIKFLISDAMDLVRVQSGKIQLQIECLTVREMFRYAEQSVASLMHERNHKLRIDQPSGDVWFEGDPIRVQQILTNLLVNAAKYTNPGGIINLVGEVFSKGVSLSVRDNGVGIKPENLSRIFDLWTQESRSLAKQAGGLGLGLSLVKQLVELHGGDVVAESKGEDQGSAFRVIFPVDQDVC